MTNVVVIRRTISQTLVPYKDVEEKLRRFGSTKSAKGVRFSSTNNVNTVQDRRKEWKDSAAKKVSFNAVLERSRSEVCLRRKSSYVRETSLDDFKESKEEITLPMPAIYRRRDRRSINSTGNIKGSRPLLRPQSDFFPEFEVQARKAEGEGSNIERQLNNTSPGRRLEQSIATLRREMISLRRQDRQLFTQLSTMNEHIKELKELAEMRGGLFGPSRDDEEGSCVSCEDDGEVGERSNTPQKVQMDNSKVQLKHVTSPRSVLNNKRTTPRNSTNYKNVEMKNNKVSVPQETSFEYVEQETSLNKRPRVSAVQTPRVLVKKSGKTAVVTAQVSRRETTVRLERKSFSCQFLNSANTTAWKRNSFVGKTESNRYSEKQIDTKPQKSASLTHLKPRRSQAKPADASTSDSECSTSGCYGGSSTGSDVDLERIGNYGDFDETMRNQVFETKLKSEKKPIRYQSASEVGQFRKQIISV